MPAWKKIWKPVVISEWFPSPDHHDHHHKPVEYGWDRKDEASGGKVIWKRSETESKTKQELVPDSNSSAEPLAATNAKSAETSSAWKFPN